MEPYTVEAGDVPRLAKILGVSEASMLHAFETLHEQDALAAQRAAEQEEPVCAAFAWIGQSFKYCDDCGHPLWEHTHRRGTGLNFGMLIPISREEAEEYREEFEDR